jgi:two-component sensor histidine kinase/ActR/RegA family two-component response regulator
MKRILVIDNNEMMLEFMRELLEGEGYVTRTADGGLQALQMLPDFTPDAIFVDLVMPEIDGKRLCRLLRMQEGAQNSYIFVLSAIAAEDREQDISAYADAYVAKAPFKLLRENILTMLADFEAGRGEKYADTIVGLDSIYTREITRELLHSRRHMDEILSQISDGFIELTADDYTVVYANPAAASFMNMSENELITCRFPELFSPASRDYISARLAELENDSCTLGEEHSVMAGERQFKLKCTHIVYEQHRSILVLMEDISERKRNEQLVHKSLKEKEVLLQEIHHRVKNNFQIISSILNLQLNSSEDSQVQELLRVSQNRIDAMSLIHENIYRSENLTRISLQDYLEDLLGRLTATYGPRHVKAEVQAEGREISLVNAIPIGLIVNELVTNSLIHGLQENTDPRLQVSLSLEGDGQFLLTVTDNGAGFPDGFLEEPSDSLGMLIVRNLVNQLEGSLSFSSDGGAVTTVRFSVTE